MNIEYRRWLSQLLVLVLVLNPLQLSFAMQLNPQHHDSCLVSGQVHHSTHESDLLQPPLCEEHDHGAQCFDHPACVAHINFSPIQSQFALSSTLRTATRLKFHRQQLAVLSHFPELLTRPPRIDG